MHNPAKNKGREATIGNGNFKSLWQTLQKDIKRDVRGKQGGEIRFQLQITEKPLSFLLVFDQYHPL